MVKKRKPSSQTGPHLKPRIRTSRTSCQLATPPATAEHRPGHADLIHLQLQNLGLRFVTKIAPRREGDVGRSTDTPFRSVRQLKRLAGVGTPSVWGRCRDRVTVWDGVSTLRPRRFVLGRPLSQARTGRAGEGARSGGRFIPRRSSPCCSQRLGRRRWPPAAHGRHCRPRPWPTASRFAAPRASVPLLP